MEKVKINFVNFWGNFNKEDNFITEIIKTKYQVEISENPDYVFASVLGEDMDFLKYEDAIRIFYTGENVIPDFNLYDYAIGFCHLKFSDRYMRYPLYRNKIYRENWKKAQLKHTIPRREYEQKHTGFCNFVYSNSQIVMPEREQLLNMMDLYKRVDCGGRYRNNVGGPVADKLEFCSNYKFTIAVENTSSPGYTTEKLIDAWAAGTIPIYYGDPLIAKEFNNKAFVNCHDCDNFEDVMEVVKKLDTNDDAYAEMMSEPICMFSENSDETDSELRDFILHILSQPKECAYRRDRYAWGKVYENRLIGLYELKNNVIIKALYKTYKTLKSTMFKLFRKKRG